MINLVSTLKKKTGEVCAKCRIKLYKIRKTCDLSGNPRADSSELQKLSKSLIHPMKQKMLVLQMLLLKY
jgi:hypothetical protein